jgi:hypothetical protein
MACPAYGSSSEVSLWYTEDNDETTLWTDTLTWKSVPITGESLDAALSSTISEEITTARSYANSVITQGEVTGGFNFEAQPSTFFFDFLIAALQSPLDMSIQTGGTQWAHNAAITNGSTKKCLAFVKRVQVSSTPTYDWFIFRGVQVGSMSLELSPGALMTGSCNLMGIKPEAAQTDAAAPVTWTLTATTGAPLFSGTGSHTLEIQNSSGTDTTAVLQSLSLTFDNQLRQQQGVGLGHPFAAGIGSGRFMASASASVYYQSPTIYNALLADTELKLYAALRNGDDDGINILLDKLKVTSGGLPMASGPDQDLLISTEFRAFESASNGTAKITRITPP